MLWGRRCLIVIAGKCPVHRSMVLVGYDNVDIHIVEGAYDTDFVVCCLKGFELKDLVYLHINCCYHNQVAIG